MRQAAVRMIVINHTGAEMKIALLAVLSLAMNAQAADSQQILTPPSPATPRINGPAVFGVRPNSPLIYRIPASGLRPMDFTIDGLPAGLKVDAQTGEISGKLAEQGDHIVKLRAKNSLGSDQKKFKIVVGEKISLTPPMGWNSWNCWGGRVTAEKVL